MRRLLFVFLAACAPGPALAQDVSFFQTPSGNIHCALIDGDGGFADCEIVQVTTRSPMPPRPADCDLDYGDRFQLASGGPAIMGCYGDTVRGPDSPVLGYGMSMAAGAVTCSSAQNGLTCVNADGHGFFLSKARQELF